MFFSPCFTEIQKFDCKYCTQLKVTAELLDEAPNAVDDLYEGCHEQISQNSVISKLLGEETKRSPKFKKAWDLATNCLDNSKTMSTTGLLAYYNMDEDFRKSFNNQVKTLGFNESTYKNQFHFKSFHFLLMDSMTRLSPHKCKTVHALPEEQYEAKKGSLVRLGQFTTVYSSYSELIEMEDINGLVLLNITTCFFAKIGNNECIEEDKTLLSPAEVFTVEDVVKVQIEKEEHTEIVLKHYNIQSSHNCLLFPR